MKHTFVVPGRPAVKQRPRLGRKRRVYTPIETLAYEQHVADSYRASEGEPFDGPVCVDILLDEDKATVTITSLPEYRKSKLRGDVDNYAKAILDGLQTGGVAFADDRQVLALTVIKSEMSSQPVKATARKKRAA